MHRITSSRTLIGTIQTLLIITTCAEASNSKRGLALVQDSVSDLGKASGGQCSWFYNWSPTPPSNSEGLTFIPMQWGSANAASFADTVKKLGAKTILGFNEPDMPAQSNLPAAQAAQLWQQYIEPLKSSGVRLGSPAVSSGPNGLPWLTAFEKACTGCTIDFIVVHWYGEGADNFSKYLESVHSQFPGKPIWVTEFADTSTSASDISTFMAAALKYLDAQSWIEGYSWFAFTRTPSSGLETNLLDGSGNLNALGTSYISGSKARRMVSRSKQSIS